MCIRDRPRAVVAAGSSARVIMGAAAPQNVSETLIDSQLEPVQKSDVRENEQPQAQETAQATAPDSGEPLEKLKGAVLQALAENNQRILVSMLEAGHWAVEGNELVIKVSDSQSIIDMSVGAEARRLAIAAASGVFGRAMKLKIVPGASSAQKGNGTRSSVTSAAGSGRSRAEQDAVVRRLQEKFGAEIRTVIDYREKDEEI